MTDYCTLAQVREELVKQGSGAADDAAITARIPRACGWLDRECRYDFQGASHRRAFDDEAIAGEIRRGQQVQMSADGVLTVTVSKGFCQSVTSAEWSSDLRTWQALSLSQLDIDGYVLSFLGANVPSTSRLFARLSYRGGFSVLPDEITQAATMLSAWLFTRREAPSGTIIYPDGGNVVVQGDLPNSFSRMVYAYRRVRP